MTANAVPVAGNFPRKFTKREAKAIETAIAGAAAADSASVQTLTNKTIDGDDNTVKDLAVTCLKTVGGNADMVVMGTSGTGVPVFAKIVNANVDAGAAIATSKLADSAQIDFLALGGTITTGGAWTQTGAHTLGVTTTDNSTITLNEVNAVSFIGVSEDPLSFTVANGGASVTLPASGTLATLAGAEVLENKSLETSCKFVDATDNTKTAAFVLSGASGNADLTLVAPITVDRAVTFQDAATTIIATPVAFQIAADGAASQVLTTNGAGALSFAAQSFLQSSVTVALTQAEIIDLHNTSKQLVAAPVAGSAIVVDSVEVYHNFDTAAYTGGGALSVQYNNTAAAGGVSICAPAVGNVTGGADSNVLINPVAYNGPAGFNILAQAAVGVFLSNADADFADGNAANIIKVVVKYRTVVLAV